jgi:hypothetical protein
MRIRITIILIRNLLVKLKILIIDIITRIN